MALIDDIKRQARREDRLITSIDAEFAAVLSQVRRQLDRRIRQLVLTLETSQNGQLVASRAALGRALRLRTEIQEVLRASGYVQMVDAALDAPLDRLAVEVLRGRSVVARAASITNVDLETLTAWKAIRRRDLLSVGDDVVQAVWRSTVDGVIGARSVSSLVNEISDLTDTTERQARTIYDTAVSTYARQVDQLGVDPSPSDRFVYVGPNDAKTRPFCQEWVGKVLTRRELDGLSNNQMPNTLLTGGGWNCRHKWLFLADNELEDFAA